MQASRTRRSLLLAAAAAPFASSLAFADDSIDARFAALEKTSGGRLGVAALDPGNGRQLAYRGDERFPMCSTFKTIVAAAILRRSEQDARLLQKRIKYAKKELVSWSPITEKHVGAGMTVQDLCAATIQYSDNTAANLLMKTLGGPAGVTAFMRTIGDSVFRLDRWETELNEGTPGDPRDTTSPVAMMRSLQKLTLGDALGLPQRTQLQEWLIGNTTGDKRIRAGVPAGWKVGDKTGTGNYGITNDTAVLWPPGRQPIVVAIYLAGTERDAETRNDVIAAAAKLVAEAFA